MNSRISKNLQSAYCPKIIRELLTWSMQKVPGRKSVWFLSFKLVKCFLMRSDTPLRRVLFFAIFTITPFFQSLEKVTNSLDSCRSENSSSAETAGAAINHSAGRSSSPTGLLRLSALMTEMVSLLVDFSSTWRDSLHPHVTVTRYIIHQRRHITGCHTIDNRDEVFLQPFSCSL